MEGGLTFVSVWRFLGPRWFWLSTVTLACLETQTQVTWPIFARAGRDSKAPAFVGGQS